MSQDDERDHAEEAWLAEMCPMCDGSPCVGGGEKGSCDLLDNLPVVQQLQPERRELFDEVAAQWQAELTESTRKALETLAPNGVLPEVSEEAGELLNILRILRKSLAEVESMAESHLVGLMQRDNQHIVVGRHTYERKGGSSSAKWQGRGVVQELVKLAIDQGWDLQAFANALTDASGIDNASHKSWRTTKLKAMGINPKKYSDRVSGRQRIEIV